MPSFDTRFLTPAVWHVANREDSDAMSDAANPSPPDSRRPPPLRRSRAMPAKPAGSRPRRAKTAGTSSFEFITSPFAIAWAAFIGHHGRLGPGVDPLPLPQRPVRAAEQGQGRLRRAISKTARSSRSSRTGTSGSSRYEGKIYALSTTCTHLGCTPNWLEARQEVQVPLPRQRLLHHRRQLRRPRPAAAGTLGHQRATTASSSWTRARSSRANSASGTTRSRSSRCDSQVGVRIAHHSNGERANPT